MAVTLPRFAVARAPALAGNAALGGAVACGALICVDAAAGRSPLTPASWHGMPSWMSGPLHGLGTGALTSHGFAALFLAMCACYAVVLATARHVDGRVAIGAVVALHVLFLVAPPLLSADVFGYVDYARIAALHGIDPYAHGPASAPHDGVFAFMRWRGDMPSPYGPLFTLSTYALAPLSVAASLWLLKGAAALASLAIVWLVYDCARRLGIAALPAALFVGLNPLVLVWAVGGAHNDLLVVAAVTASVWLAVSGRDRLAGAGLVTAVGLKLSAGIALPFMLIRRRRALEAVLATGAAAMAVTLAAFGTGVAGMLRAQADQQGIVATESVPEQVGRALGLGGATAGLRAVALAGFGAVFAALLVRTWRGRIGWIAATAWATLAMLVTSAWLMPWYVSWLLPLAALGRDRRLGAATLALCAYLVVMRVPI
jgi:alpha-1,6-mannosyltransferase